MNKMEKKQLDFLSRLYSQQLRSNDRLAAEKTKDKYFYFLAQIKERSKNER